MPTYQSTPRCEHGLPKSTGILIVNLGTPDAPTTTAVRRFLKQFLSDPRVVEYPRLLWWIVLNVVILQFRPPRSAAAYRKIWTDQGSPLLIHSQAIANRLRDRLVSQPNGAVHVELAMTYGEPSIASAIDNLLARGACRIITLPLFPQYSGTTTAAVFDAIARKLGRLRWVPEFRFINSYHDARGYISALAASVREFREQNGRSEKLLMSFHGIPTRTVRNGDPYQSHCEQTARLLADELDLSNDEWLISYQSRVGRGEWLSPYTEETIKALAKQGLSRLDVVCPGFAADCLETLEEIELQNAEFFSAAGGESLRYVPALNARADHVQFLAELVEGHIAGWTSGANDAAHRATRDRADAIGAAS